MVNCNCINTSNTCKFESTTLPIVLNELENIKINLKKIVIVPSYDIQTMRSIKNFDCDVIYQKGEGFVMQLYKD